MSAYLGFSGKAGFSSERIFPKTNFNTLLQPVEASRVYFSFLLPVARQIVILKVLTILQLFTYHVER